MFTTQDMRIVQIGTIICIGDRHDKKIIMKIYDGFVCLTEPNVTWDSNVLFNIELLKNGTTFTVADNM